MTSIELPCFVDVCLLPLSLDKTVVHRAARSIPGREWTIQIVTHERRWQVRVSLSSLLLMMVTCLDFLIPVWKASRD